MDISLTNDAGSTTWSIGTTVAGTAVTLDSDKAVTATFGVTGNTVVCSHTAERAAKLQLLHLLSMQLLKRCIHYSCNFT